MAGTPLPEPDEPEATRSGADEPEDLRDRRREKGEEGSGVRPLRRSRDERLVAGVAGGLGRYLRVDPVLVRVAFVILAVAGGVGFVLYVIGALVIPEEKPGDRRAEEDPSKVRSLRQVIGWGLIAVGAVLLVDRFVPDFGRIIWPVILLAIGFAVLVQSTRRSS